MHKPLLIEMTFNQLNCPRESAINRMVQRFQATDSVEDQKAKKFSRSICSLENFDLVSASDVEEPRMFIARYRQKMTKLFWRELNNISRQVIWINSTGLHFTL